MSLLFGYATLFNSGVSFSPSDVAGLTMWLDASDNTTLTLSGSDVTGWESKAGSVNDLVVPGGSVSPRIGVNTIGGRQAIDFDPTRADLLQSTSAGSAIFAAGTAFIYAVCHVKGLGTAPSTTPYAGPGILCDANGWWGIHTGNGFGIGSYAFNGGVFLEDEASGIEDVDMIVRFRKSAGQIALRIDDNAEQSRAMVPNIGNITNPIRIGPGSTASGTEADFIIGEILTFNQAVSAGDDASIMNYLTNKWSI